MNNNPGNPRSGQPNDRSNPEMIARSMRKVFLDIKSFMRMGNCAKIQNFCCMLMDYQYTDFSDG
jgi:hypothetical protein